MSVSPGTAASTNERLNWGTSITLTTRCGPVIGLTEAGCGGVTGRQSPRRLTLRNGEMGEECDVNHREFTDNIHYWSRGGGGCAWVESIGVEGGIDSQSHTT